jgi:hypothetical protein
MACMPAYCSLGLPSPSPRGMEDSGPAIKQVCVQFIELCRQMGLLPEQLLDHLVGELLEMQWHRVQHAAAD